MSDEVQVNLRLPRPLKDKIHLHAKDNNRSLNAELVERLMNSFVTLNDNYQNVVEAVNELANRFQTSERISDISARLNFLLEGTRKMPLAPYLTPSLIAKKLGYEYATETEKWFKGKAEPSFSQLKLLANYFGCNDNWLQFGIGKPFVVKNYSQFRNVADVVDFCTTPDDGFDKVSEVLFIRKDSQAGEILIVKVFNSHSCQVYTTGVHLSEVVGATGTLYRAILTLVLEAFCRSKWKMKVYSYLVKPDMYDTLISGEQNALQTLARFDFSTWMEDIWSESTVAKSNEYWDGYRSLVDDIELSIKENEKLLKDKNAIEKGAHEAISLLNGRYFEYFD